MTILVTYASRSGSTAGIAEEIGHVLTQQGILVDVRPMQEVNDITAYQAVVAGSAIRQEQWLPEAMHFMETHQRELAEKPVATFLVCMALATEKQQRHAKALQSACQWMTPVRNLVHPVSEGLFAGALDPNTIAERSFRVALRLLIALGFWSAGDFRDWDAIRQWAHDLLPHLPTQVNTAPDSPISINQ